MPFYKTDQW